MNKPYIDNAMDGIMTSTSTIEGSTGVTSAGMPFASTVCGSPASSGQLLSPDGSKLNMIMSEAFDKNKKKNEPSGATKRNIAATYESNKTEEEEEGSAGKRNECMKLFHGTVVSFFEACVDYYDGSLLAFKPPKGYVKGFPTVRNLQQFNYNEDWVNAKKKELEAEFNQIVISSSAAGAYELLRVKYNVELTPQDLKSALRATFKKVHGSPAKLGFFVTSIVDQFFEENVCFCFCMFFIIYVCMYLYFIYIHIHCFCYIIYIYIYIYVCIYI